MNNVKFTGVMPALVTPLNADETINEAASRKLMQWLLSEGMDGFYLCGGTGEGPVVQKNERMKLAEIAREETQGKGDLIVHVGAIDLKTAAELAALIGADEATTIRNCEGASPTSSSKRIGSPLPSTDAFAVNDLRSSVALVNAV